jgi:methionyl-tRNA formyltransferase
MSRISAVFLGSPEFAVPCLEALASTDDIDIALVVTQPDRRAGRGRDLRPPAVKVAAERCGLPVYQPDSLRSDEAYRELSAISPNVMIVVSYGEILQRRILELPKWGCLNVHPSLLPKYRGAVPIPATILNGDRSSGLSIIKLVRQMDAGPVLFQTSFELDGTETSGSLSERLSQLAARHLPDVVRDWTANRIEAVEQDHSSATYTRELRKSDAQIDWRWSAEYVERFVRAMDPWPRAWTIAGGQRLSINSAAVNHNATASSDLPPGTVVLDGEAVVVTGNGAVTLGEVQPAGKKQMAATDWLRGTRSSSEIVFELPAEEPSPIIYTRE